MLLIDSSRNNSHGAARDYLAKIHTTKQQLAQLNPHSAVQQTRELETSLRQFERAGRTYILLGWLRPNKSLSLLGLSLTFHMVLQPRKSWRRLFC